jgi:hypothetical protein
MWEYPHAALSMITYGITAYGITAYGITAYGITAYGITAYGITAYGITAYGITAYGTGPAPSRPVAGVTAGTNTGPVMSGDDILGLLPPACPLRGRQPQH